MERKINIDATDLGTNDEKMRTVANRMQGYVWKFVMDEAVQSFVLFCVHV